MLKKSRTSEEETPKETVLKVGDLDPRFKYETSKLPGAEKVTLCFQCGTCTADCPIARFYDSYRPRKTLRMTQLGLKKSFSRTMLSGSVLPVLLALTNVHKM